MTASVSIVDVAAYILARGEHNGDTGSMFLRFDAQAAHLVQHELLCLRRPTHGSMALVCLQLPYRLHRGKPDLTRRIRPSGNPSALTDAERVLIDRVCALWAA